MIEILISEVGPNAHLVNPWCFTRYKSNELYTHRLIKNKKVLQESL